MIHCGWLYASARCPIGSVSNGGASSAIQVSRSLLAISRSTALANPVAPGATERTSSTVAETAACAGTRV